jgi:uncharacterized protein (DUF302 family)
MHKLFIAISIVFVFTAPAFAEQGLIRVKSSHDVKNTAARLENIVKEKGMNVFLRINHAQGARKVGKDLRPTELLIFGNPKVGAPLMQCSQTIAIDLPQKALIWEDKTGQVWLTYNDPIYLANRHNISSCKEVLEKVKNALNSFAKNATKP